ncbi:MAG TPA: (deoxy)nucleoside triphosphate pyrophosphohydrolase [Polyangia bacterium]
MSDTVRVVAAVIRKDDSYLITQRREFAVLPMLWEFPGGRVEPGEQDEDALQRELRERLEAAIVVDGKLGERRHVYRGYTVELALYAVHLTSDHLKAVGVRDFRWVNSNEFDQYRFPDADQATMDALLGMGKARA